MEIEVMDRAFTLQLMVDQLLDEHVVIGMAGCDKEVTQIQDALAVIYNKVGLHFDKAP